jgi:predicted RNA-binding Zn ribbon-like protein
MGDEQLTAPGDLELVRSFVNTRDLELGTDRLATADGLAAWLRERIPQAVPTSGSGGPSDQARRRAVALREALRALLLANATGGSPPPGAVAVVEQAGRRAPLRFDGTRLVPAVGGVDGALARLLAIVATAQADGTWARLKACPGEACQWALYDRTRSRTRTWCAAAKCGARTRSRAYRRRVAAAPRGAEGRTSAG